MLALQDRFSESWAFLNSLEHPGFVNAEAKHVSELYLLAYLAMSHPDDSVLASVPSIMGVLRNRCIGPEWSRRVEVLQEQLLESFEGKARPPAASDLLRMRPHTARTAQINSFAFSVKVRNEDKTFVELLASGLDSSSTAYIKIFRLDIEVIFSKDPFLVAGRDNAITAGSMFAAVVPHAVIEEVLEPDAKNNGAASICKVVELPTLQSSSCFFLAVECNGVKTGQTVFKRYLDCTHSHCDTAASCVRSRMAIACAEQLGIITVRCARCATLCNILLHRRHFSAAMLQL